MSSDLAPEVVTPLLQGRLGSPYRFIAECESTQRLLGAGEPEGSTAATDHQTAGRGRLGRVWEDTPGDALLFSVVLHPTPPLAFWPELSVVAGEAVAAALPLEATVSYPNDVMVGERKIAGILPEATAVGGVFRPGAGGSAGGASSHRDDRVVLGIGVNVNQAAADLPAAAVKPPTSLRLETGREWERAPLLAAILFELERLYDAWQERAG